MRVGVVSDVHNNVAALEYALDYLGHCDVILNLGDLVSDYSVNPEIIRVARDAGLWSIAGNHEKAILLHPGSTLRDRLAPEDLAYLRALPPRRDVTFDGRSVVVAHGAPWDDPHQYRCEYVYATDTAALSRLSEMDADVVLLGHTHHAMSLRLDSAPRPVSVLPSGSLRCRRSVLVLNPGSCGEARDRAVGLSFAELDFANGVATTYQLREGASPEPILRADL